MIKLNLKLFILSSAFILLLSLPPASINAQGHSELKVVPEVRNEWVKQLRKSLKEIKPNNVSTKVNLETYGEGKIIHQKYRINKAGLIQFNSKEWVYVTLHSQHDDDAIGDLAIAIDQNGKYYYHLGHVCGETVRYQAATTNILNSSKDFFLYFKDDVDDLYWHRLKGGSIPVSRKRHE
jgi:hypothetical protein